MKKNIAIVAGGDSSEIVISLKSADGIYSFIDKDKYNLYIAIVKRDEWAVILPSGEHTPIDKNDYSFRENGEVKHFDFAYITIHGTPGEGGDITNRGKRVKQLTRKDVAIYEEADYLFKICSEWKP